MKTKPTKLRPCLISAFAKLVIANKYTLNEADVTEEIQLVPEAYQEAVSEFLIKYNKG